MLRPVMTVRDQLDNGNCKASMSALLRSRYLGSWLKIRREQAHSKSASHTLGLLYAELALAQSSAFSWDLSV
jgi:hypothetical protein